MKNGFNTLAGIYDLLSRIALLGRIQKSQLDVLAHIGPANRALIVGGGTGVFLPKLLEKLPELKIDWIDSSDKMIANTKRRLTETQCKNIIFHSCDIADFHTDESYDLIISNFFLDCFMHEKLANIIKSLDDKLEVNGIWIVCDFKQCGLISKLYIKMMYLFFRAICGIQATHISDYFKSIEMLGYKEEEKLGYMNGFIQAEKFVKTEPG
ncbi:MAG: class I SAM-dependent methyltransferase [Lentisphaeria bacterium]|nr:class I SAM-dependent methyltransferase [Lentisphaeria bacterium]NQZ70801.1 class I SAM-dependent methyltransferase [Lentisphaeria bacterium]